MTAGMAARCLVFMAGCKGGCFRKPSGPEIHAEGTFRTGDLRPGSGKGTGHGGLIAVDRADSGQNPDPGRPGFQWDD